MFHSSPPSASPMLMYSRATLRRNKSGSRLNAAVMSLRLPAVITTTGSGDSRSVFTTRVTPP